MDTFKDLIETRKQVNDQWSKIRTKIDNEARLAHLALDILIKAVETHCQNRNHSITYSLSDIIQDEVRKTNKHFQLTPVEISQIIQQHIEKYSEGRVKLRFMEGCDEDWIVLRFE